MNVNDKAALQLLAELQHLDAADTQSNPDQNPAVRVTIRTASGEFIGEALLSLRAADEAANALSAVTGFALADPARYQAGRSAPDAPALTDDERDLHDQLDDLFSRVDLDLLTKNVLSDAKPTERLAVTQAIDGMFGHIPHWDAEDGGL